MTGRGRRPARGWIQGLAAVLLLLALCLALGLPRYRARIDLSDEGLLVYGAERVLQGDLPNRDFVSLQPPASFYTTALVFRLLGISLASGRIFGLLLYLLIPLGVYLVSRQITGEGTALAAALPAPFLGMTIWVYAPYPTAQGLVWTLASAWLLLRAARFARDAEEDPGRRPGGTVPAVAAGVTTALAGLTRHDQGFYLMAATVLFLTLMPFLEAAAGNPWGRARRLAACWLGGAAALLLPLLVVWATAGALPAMYRDLVRFPLVRYADTSSLPMPGPAPGGTLGEHVLVGLFYLAPVLGGGALIRLAWLRIRGPLEPYEVRAFFVALLCLGFHHQVWTRSDVYHLVDTLPPLFVVGAYWMETGRRALLSLRPGSGRRMPAAAAAGMGVIFWGGVVGLTGDTFLLPALEGGVPLGGVRGGVVLPASEAWVAPTRDLLRSRVPQGRSILVLPYQPMFYFLADRRNPTAWNYLWPGDQREQDHRALLRQADADPPAAVLLFDREEMEGHAATVLEWIDRHYEEAARGAGGALRFYLPRGGATRR